MKKMANTTEQVITGISQADAVRRRRHADTDRTREISPAARGRTAAGGARAYESPRRDEGTVGQLQVLRSVSTVPDPSRRRDRQVGMVRTIRRATPARAR